MSAGNRFKCAFPANLRKSVAAARVAGTEFADSEYNCCSSSFGCVKIEGDFRLSWLIAWGPTGGAILHGLALIGE